MKLKIKLLSLSLLLSLISSFFSPLAVFAAYDQSAAQNYLLSKANNPWATMALAAQGTTGIPSDYLKTVTADSAVGYEAPILAITSLGQDPRNFGGDNYITKLENFYSTGQIGDAGLLNDDFFGILALASAGVPATDRIIVDSKNFILSHQNADGGWSWSTDGGSDSNDTAAAVMALKAAGTPVSDTQLQSAINYLHTTQNTDGGFKANLSSDASDSASTSWVIWALNSLGIDPSAWTQGDNTPLNFLASYQTGSGYFKWKADDAGESSPAITANAVIALTGKFLPIHTITAPTGSQQENSGNPEQAPSFSFRIEGSNQTVCEGQAAGPTALDVIKNASGPCGFTYHITTSSWGDYLDKINDEAASGSAGWLYFVNNVSPDVGAANYNLQTNDAVLWYFGDWGLTPTRLSLSSAEITAGGSVTATVEYYASSTWQTLNGADVYFGASSVKTGNNGQAVINPPDGYYKIYAQKKWFYPKQQQNAPGRSRPAGKQHCFPKRQYYWRPGPRHLHDRCHCFYCQSFQSGFR